MRKTVGELMLATETAERAIAGLRTTLGDCDRTLADRLRTAERYAADLADQVEAGETVMSRIAQIVDASREAASCEPRRRAGRRHRPRARTGERLARRWPPREALADAGGAAAA